jgi:hypothetical protein
MTLGDPTHCPNPAHDPDDIGLNQPEIMNAIDTERMEQDASGNPVPTVSPLAQENASTLMEYFRTHLQQVVTLHTAIFEKLLFEEPDIPLELAEFLEDAANKYLDISEKISRHYRQQHPLGQSDLGLAQSGTVGPIDSDGMNQDQRGKPASVAAQPALDIEQHPDSNVIFVRWMTEPKLGVEPRIAGTENLAKPLKNEPHRP